MAEKNIVIIDYKVGNLQSVEAAFARQGMKTVLSRDPEVIRQADAIVLPGVGAFPVAMKNLADFGLIELLRERAGAGVPFLGICLGMQVLFERGTENEPTAGLALLKGSVDAMVVNEKLPHMGWNQLHFDQAQHALLSNITAGDEVYFVHSYAANCPESELIAHADYGGLKIPAVVGKNNVLGCQFHPEKSGQIGAQILRAFKEMI